MLPIRVNDLRWTWNGDIVIGPNGDIGDTKVHGLLSFVQEIKTRCRSELYDWKMHPHLGANMSDLIGRPNNRETAETGKARLHSALTRDGFIASRLIEILYTPTGRHHILYRLTVNVPDYGKDEQIQLNLLFDTDEFELTFL